MTYISSHLYVLYPSREAAGKLAQLFSRLKLEPEILDGSFKFTPLEIHGPMLDDAFAIQFATAVRAAGGKIAGGPWAEILNGRGDAALKAQKPKMRP
jgi:hypothetical protein